MASPANVEVLESAAEFEENFRDTVISADVPANVVEAQATFQDIQHELQEFIFQHLSKIVALQKTISNHVHLDSPGSKIASSDGHETDANPNIVVDAASDQANCNQGVMPSRHSSANPVRAPLESHLRSLNGFLDAHIENLHALQNSFRSIGGKKLVATGIQKPMAAPSDVNDGFYDSLTQQFNMLVVISTFTAGLIVSFLSLVAQLIGSNHRTPFNIGMLFAFFALAFHLGNLIVAGRGAAITAQHLVIGSKQYDPGYFRFYLSVCEQLQFAATLLFIVSIVILTFYIFISLAFPLVLLFISAIGALVVFWSSYWKVSITFRNFKFLVQNLRRLRWRSLAYMKAREGQHA